MSGPYVGLKISARTYSEQTPQKSDVTGASITDRITSAGYFTGAIHTGRHLDLKHYMGYQIAIN